MNMVPPMQLCTPASANHIPSVSALWNGEREERSNCSCTRKYKTAQKNISFLIWCTHSHSVFSSGSIFLDPSLVIGIHLY
ncbi:hypothetical protein GDO81_020673 [Engystomops pustulosus]|uniref:Uncharacterized protein n=1 Tax=Engystomops pustulosus TaxID=76066 RepID=A0AAV6YU66_ENGPU|nr:hypothetical protein GDO81_020673 [Engystomops pustulosus]